MTFHRNAPDGPDQVPAGTETAEVREIYPGARQARPVQVFPRPDRRQRKLLRSEAGMATAEYAVVFCLSVTPMCRTFFGSGKTKIGKVSLIYGGDVTIPSR